MKIKTFDFMTNFMTANIDATLNRFISEVKVIDIKVVEMQKVNQNGPHYVRYTIMYEDK